MPSLRKDKKSGNYFIDYYVGTTRKRESLLTPDIKLARIRYRFKLNKLQTQQQFPIATIQEFLDEYKAHFHLTGKKSPTTIDVEKHILNRFLSVCHVKLLAELTPKVMDDIFIKLSQGNRPETANMYRRTLAGIFERAVKWELIEKNPLRTVEKVQWQRDMPRVLEPQELVALFTKARTLRPDLAQYFLFLLLTGMRRSEALNLSWSDIDYIKQLITLKHTKSKVPRFVLITPRIAAILHTLKHLPQPFPFKPSHVSRWFHKCVTESNIKHCKLHDLRKTFSTYIQQAGMPSNIVSAMLGHQTQDITRTYYTGVYSDMLIPIYNKFEKDLAKSLPMTARKVKSG